MITYVKNVEVDVLEDKILKKMRVKKKMSSFIKKYFKTQLQQQQNKYNILPKIKNPININRKGCVKFHCLLNNNFYWTFKIIIQNPCNI